MLGGKQIVMKLLLTGLRRGLGNLILFIDWLTRPRAPKRDPQAQAQVDAETASLALYQFKLCPFCIKTRRSLRRLGLNIETRDAMQEPHRGELLAGGGEIKVPCLAIEEDGKTRWMYESDDIISYLDQRFAKV